ncbi:MAG: hypothetical protein ACRYFS_26160 [Janthinobacterium lividum]
MKLTSYLQPILLSTLLCGSLIAPALAQDTPADTSSASAVADGSTHQYLFEAKQSPAPDGGTSVYVRLSDSLDESFHKRILYVLDDAGKYKRFDRAQIIAGRLNDAVKADPNFVNNILPPANVGTEVVLKLKNQTDGWIITADEGSMRASNASSRQEYAQRIMAAIQDRLKGIKLRDAAFDYQLNPDQKKVRASEYFDQAQDAYDNKETNVSVSKYQLALKLQPNWNYCRLQLANLYAEMNDKSKAREQYLLVKEKDTNAADKKVASEKLLSLGAG